MQIFNDRKEVGIKLSKLLLRYKDQRPVIYALPRGGLPVAFEVAKIINSPLSLIITRKIGHQDNPEFALAAITEDGEMVAGIKGEREMSITDKLWLESEIENAKLEIKRRKELYFGRMKSISARDRVAIIIDDGVATGLDMIAAINYIKRQNPKKIIAATGVCPRDTFNEIKSKVSDFICLIVPEYFKGVGAYYRNFPQITDSEVVNMLKSQKRR
jgi:predicted phosphoribosyltransferase